MGRKQVLYTQTEIDHKINELTQQIQQTESINEKRNLTNKLSYWKNHEKRVAKRRADIIKQKITSLPQKIQQLQTELITLPQNLT